MRKRKMNNKGFSLVELIVVMAIMAILAVTFAPKLMHYVDKANKVNDQEIVNTVYNTTKLSLMDETLLSNFKSLATTYDDTTTTAGIDFYFIDLSTYYTLTSTSNWAVGASNNGFMKEIYGVVDDFKLKSKTPAASTSSNIVICYNALTDEIKVFLDYDGSITLPATGATSATAIATVDGYFTGATAADYSVHE